jgi:hypothetical protein
MPVKTKNRRKLHALHHGKAGTIHKAEILIPEFAEDIPGPFFIGRRNRNYPDETALHQLLPETTRGIMPGSIANKGDCFRENEVGGDERYRVGSQKSRCSLMIGIIAVNQGIPGAGRNSGGRLFNSTTLQNNPNNVTNPHRRPY